MTVLNKQQLLDSFPDNNEKLIQPLDMRNFVDSVELKYDNWTVVKPGQPLGNKFPDPVNEEIILPEGTVWVLNGQIGVFGEIVPENDTAIISLTGEFTFSSVALDASLVGKSLIKLDDANVTMTFKGASLASLDASQQIFNIQNYNIITMDSCALLGSGPGSNLGFMNNGNVTIIQDCIFLASQNGLVCGGTHIAFSVVGCQNGAGFTGIGNMFDFTGSVQRATFTRNLATATGSDFFFARVVDDNTWEQGLVVTNILDKETFPDSEFVTGITAIDSINTDFNNNVGFINTNAFGNIVMSYNANVTTNPGQNIWTPIIGNGQDILDDNSSRFVRSSPLEFTYIGKEPEGFLIGITLSARRATGSGQTPFDFGISVNDIIQSEPLTIDIASLTSVGTTASVQLTNIWLGLRDGQLVTIEGADQPEYNGTFTVTNANEGAGTFDYSFGGAISPATGLPTATLPVEVFSSIGLTNVVNSAALQVTRILNNGDKLNVNVRAEATGTIDSVIEQFNFSVGIGD